MSGLEDFMATFGFTADAITIVIVCAVVLLANFAGGLFTNIIRAFGGPIHESKLYQRTSFRLAVVSELFLIIYIVYYHMALGIALEVAGIIYWVFFLLAAPLIGAIGAQLIYIVFASKIEELKKEGRRIAAAESGDGEFDEDEDEGGAEAAKG